MPIGWGDSYTLKRNKWFLYTKYSKGERRKKKTQFLLFSINTKKIFSALYLSRASCGKNPVGPCRSMTGNDDDDDGWWSRAHFLLFSFIFLFFCFVFLLPLRRIYIGAVYNPWWKTLSGLGISIDEPLEYNQHNNGYSTRITHLSLNVLNIFFFFFFFFFGKFE